MYSRIQKALRPGSVRTRLTFWYLVTLGTALATFAVVVFIIRARALERELDIALEVRGYQLASELRPALLDLDESARPAGNDGVAGEPLLVRRPSGETLFHSPAFPALDAAGERAAAAAARAGSGHSTLRDRSGTPVRVVTLSIARSDTGALVVQVAGSTAPVRAGLRNTALALAGAILVVLTIAGFGSHFTTSRALAPVDEIVRRVQHIQAARPGDRLDIQADSDEIERLVLTLNGMLDRIDASVRSARRFAADVSHELQTPIAAMRAVAEMSLKTGCSSSRCTALLGDQLAEIERLSALVRDLRLLALVDAGQLFDRPEPVDVAALTTECCEIARAVAEEQEIEVEAILCDRPVVLGSALHLRRVVLNLAQNAIRYSPPASAIVVQVDRADAHARVVVRDHGCGIAAADLPHIFKPFYRADPARARDTGGTGLGLALVDQIVRAHGGRVDVSSTPGHGSTFAVYLPLTSLAPLTGGRDP